MPVEFLLYQVTIHNKRSKCPPTESVNARTCLLHPFKGPGAAANGLGRHQECAGEVSPHFQLGQNRLGFLKCLIDTDLNGLRSGEH